MPKLNIKTTFHSIHIKHIDTPVQMFVYSAFEIQELKHACMDHIKPQNFVIFIHMTHCNHITHEISDDICILSIASLNLDQNVRHIKISFHWTIV